jgi:hypothetical protein
MVRPAAKYFFISVQTHQSRNPEKSVTEAIQVNDNSGMKVVTTVKDGKESVKKHPLTSKEILNIKNRKFMPGLFTCLDKGAKGSNKTRVSTKRHKKSITRKAK